MLDEVKEPTEVVEETKEPQPPFGAELPETPKEEKPKEEKEREERESRYQKRIDQLTWRAKTAEEKAGMLEERVGRLEEEKIRATEEKTAGELIVADGKKWYSNAALRQMITNGELTAEEAEDYKDKRNIAVAKDEAGKVSSEKRDKEEEARIRAEDADNALKKFPWMDKESPDFDPNDPKYKKAKELWAKGFRYDPRGLTAVGELVEEMFKKPVLSESLRNKRTEELGAESPTGPAAPKPKEITLDEDEKVIARRIFKDLEPEEAEKKFLQAKKRKLGGGI